MLGLFHTALLADFQSPLGRVLLMAHLGAFLLWQPVISGSQRMGPIALAVLAVGIAAFQFWLSWTSLAVWSGLLAALIAGQALPRENLRARLPELLGFAYLVIAIVAWFVPDGLAVEDSARVLFRQVAIWAGFVLIPLIFVLERGERRRVEPDPIVAAIVLLALGAIVLTAIAFMFLARSDYPTALLHAVASVACVLALLGWLWNPRGGFAGIALLMSRRALAGGFSLEEWLRRVAAVARAAKSSEQLVREAAKAFAEVPGITEISWSCERPQLAGKIGGAGRAAARFEHSGLAVTICSRQPADAPTLWRWDLMVLILAEFLRGREQAEQLSEMGYLRAIHETGARLAHDVKNQLQSLETLLWAVDQGFDRDPSGAREILRRQLPTLAGRIRLTLDRLRHPDESAVEPLAAGEWWRRLQLRHGADGIEFAGLGGDASNALPGALLDRFLDNAILNASEKRAIEPGIRIAIRGRCESGQCSVEIEDSGSAISDAIVGRLFRNPVESENGLGVGLYQVAREAEALGWILRLGENRDGAVRFVLSGDAFNLPDRDGAAEARSKPVARQSADRA
jgi:hypothetical protein